MKSKIPSVTLLLMVFAASAFAQTAAENTAVTFYKMHLTSLVNNKTIPATTRNKFLTLRMQKTVKTSTDEDPFIHGSDFEDAWRENIEIAGSQAQGKSKAIVTLILKGEATKTLAVTMLLQGATWKIDSVADKTEYGGG